LSQVRLEALREPFAVERLAEVIGTLAFHIIHAMPLPTGATEEQLLHR
jgi:hypothetical protein